MVRIHARTDQHRRARNGTGFGDISRRVPRVRRVGGGLHAREVARRQQPVVEVGSEYIGVRIVAERRSIREMTTNSTKVIEILIS